jgi:hypothetical protein
MERINLTAGQMHFSKGKKSGKSSGNEGPDPKDTLVKNLQDENTVLKAEIEKMKKLVAACNQNNCDPSPKNSIKIELETHQIKLRKIDTKDLKIDYLDIHAPMTGDLLETATCLNNLMIYDNKNPDDAISKAVELSLSSPVEVERARIRVPQESATRAAKTSPYVDLRKEGITELDIRFEKNNMMAISGWAKKILPVPFDIKGQLSITDDNLVKFQLKKQSVGKIPLPSILGKIGMSMAKGKIQGEGIKFEGKSVIIDPKYFVADNINFKITGISTENNHLVLEAGKEDKPDKQAVG